MTIFRYAMKRTIRGPLDALMLLALPIAIVFVSRETWLPIPMGLQFYGLLLLFLSSKICKIMMMDRENKVTLRISASPVTHLRYLAENLGAYTLIITVINGIVILTGMMYYGADLIEPGRMFILYSAFSIAAIGMAIAWFALFTHTESAYSVLGGLYTAIAMVGGMFWPYELMPDSVVRGIRILPTYWFSLGLRQISYEGYEGSFLITISTLVLFGVTFILIGSRKQLS